MIRGMPETPHDTWLDALPHRPPMRLVERVEHVRPGDVAVASRVARAGDWYFDGHFPGEPVVPAVVLVELLAQVGGLAAASDDSRNPPLRLRVAAFGGFKFPAAAGPGALLVATATVRGRLGPLVRVEGEVTADGRVVAIGSLTLDRGATVQGP
jgi:3-hydroxyacyl-[acyl-carrier-protein] dehydratase